MSAAQTIKSSISAIAAVEQQQSIKNHLIKEYGPTRRLNLKYGTTQQAPIRDNINVRSIQNELFTPPETGCRITFIPLRYHVFDAGGKTFSRPPPHCQQI